MSERQVPKVAVLWDERFLHHNTGLDHPESAARLLAIQPVLNNDPALVRLEPRLATREEILWLHSCRHLELVAASCHRELTYFDMDTPASRQSCTTALLAVGGLFNVLDWCMTTPQGRAFHFPRPPGHHAESDRIMGFCLFNNVALGAEYLRRKYHLQRIAIVDYDVHHGNGTQEIFYRRGDVMYISLHQYPFYPGTGAAEEKGEGVGLGRTLNFPMPAGSSDGDYERVFEASLIPQLEKFRPEFILVSAGFDAHRADPLGGLKLTAGYFGTMSRSLIEVAQGSRTHGSRTHESTHGRIAFVLEGGYNLHALAGSVEKVLEQMHLP